MCFTMYVINHWRLILFALFFSLFFFSFASFTRSARTLWVVNIIAGVLTISVVAVCVCVCVNLLVTGQSLVHSFVCFFLFLRCVASSFVVRFGLFNSSTSSNVIALIVDLTSPSRLFDAKANTLSHTHKCTKERTLIESLSFVFFKYCVIRQGV